MKFKRTVLLAIFVVTMGLLLGTSTAQAAEVIFDENIPTKAIGILNLDIGGTLYDVDFIIADALTVYGPPPGDFDFNTSSSAEAAVVAVNDALNADEALFVGEPGVDDQRTNQFYLVGWSSEQQGVFGIVNVWRGAIIDVTWEATPDATFNFDARTWAKFTLAGPPPEPVTIGGSVSDLEGSGLVLQNNGGDDEPITENGPFTFDTALTPGTSYNVTVATNPSNPDQVCVVANGSGRVPPENVTDVTVICTALVVSDVMKIAAVGDTLPDSTVLSSILLDGGVAINLMGQVAFGGRDGDGIDTVFTQAGKVVAEGDTLGDNTTLAAFRGQGEVAINAGRSMDKVAFHGMVEAGLTDIAAVFTQVGTVAEEGETISSNTTVSDIDPEGKVAINNSDEVAFHGDVEIEGGLFGDEKHRVVFISDGVRTREAAREESDLPADTPLEVIADSGGVAINEFGEVAFHGETGGVKAVFTSEKLAAKVGDTTTGGPVDVVDDIDVNGGVAINVLGEVAFHGSETQSSGDFTPAVFIAGGDTVKTAAFLGRFADDGYNVCGIDPSGGVAINLFGEVAFHGLACISSGNPFKAVFIGDGDTIQVVAKVGDLLADGNNTLTDISAGGGVALNLFGEVAFHGKVGTTGAVFVGEAP